LERNDKAREVYQRALANQPDVEFSLWSQMGLAISSIRLHDDTGAQETVDKLLSDFAGDKRVPIAACMVADEYRKADKHENASVLYQYVVDSWPDAEHALWSQMGVAISDIRLGDDAAAQEATHKLLADFAGDRRMAIAGCLLADEYRESDKYEDARLLYQYVVDTWPDAEHAMWSQMGLAISNIVLGDDLSAEAAIGKLLTDFPNEMGIQQAISSIAGQYNRLHGSEKAEQVYQSAIEALTKWPESEGQIWSRVAVVVSSIALGNDVGPDAGSDLLADFTDHPDLAEAVGLIAEGHWNQAFFEEAEGRQAKAKDCYRKAIAECERIITQLPESPQTTAQAYFMRGFCHKRLGEFEEAFEYFREVADNWPDYERADRAWFRMAQCLNELATSKRIPESDAAVLIQHACQKVIADYPDSVMADASLRLKEYWASISNKGESK
jgi:TolA-binding protein